MRRDVVRALRLLGEEKQAIRRDGGLTLRSPTEAGAVDVDAATVRQMMSDGLSTASARR